VTPLLPEESSRALERASRVKVRFTDYDWSLNGMKR